MTKLGVGGGLKLQGGQGPYQRRSRHLISLHYSNFLHVATQLPCVSRGGGSLSSHLAYTKAAAGWPYPPPGRLLCYAKRRGGEGVLEAVLGITVPALRRPRSKQHSCSQS